MAYTIQQAYDLGASAARLVTKAFARTLTNNPAAQIETDLEAAAADTVAKSGGVIPATNQALVTSGVQLTIPVTGTYATQIALTVVNGVVTAAVLS